MTSRKLRAVAVLGGVLIPFLLCELLIASMMTFRWDVPAFLDYTIPLFSLGAGFAFLLIGFRRHALVAGLVYFPLMFFLLRGFLLSRE
jgi:hypothetical protein